LNNKFDDFVEMAIGLLVVIVGFIPAVIFIIVWHVIPMVALLAIIAAGFAGVVYYISFKTLEFKMLFLIFFVFIIAYAISKYFRKGI